MHGHIQLETASNVRLRQVETATGTSLEALSLDSNHKVKHDTIAHCASDEDCVLGASQGACIWKLKLAELRLYMLCGQTKINEEATRYQLRAQQSHNCACRNQ